MVIYKTSDRIPLVLKDMTVWVRPLSTLEHAQLMQDVILEAGEEKRNNLKFVLDICMMCVTKIETTNGAKCVDGSTPELEFDESGKLSSDGLDVLTQMVGTEGLAKVSAVLSGKFQSKVDGVEIAASKAISTKKK